ncbi:hypothetical protein P8C59_004420 [Phyllachora maydis]|uniref:Uncharacterized protein n=1 Tax=Phyllachora maydis TaxID=1825666 RepID=A0AAD9I2C1_9PEZI|nr:hypothetical protein P8C59_004420 [Phyllachora maydis]
MLPPIEDSVLQNNPAFAALHTTLTTVILNPDASTKNEPGAKEREAVRQKLAKYRLRAAQESLLLHAIETAVPAEPKPTQAGRRLAKAPTTRSSDPSRASHSRQPPAELPTPLLDLLLLLPPLLHQSPPLPPSTTTLLLSHPPFSSLPSHLPALTALLSSHLRASAVHLARLANPTTNPSYLHRAIAALPVSTATLVHTSTAPEQQQQQQQQHYRAVASLVRLLAARAAVLALLVRALEAKHGVVARSLEGRAAEAGLRARGLRGAADGVRRVAAAAVYTPEVDRALAAYARHLRDAKGRVQEHMRVLRERLAAYGVGAGGDGEGAGDVARERTMRELARVRRELERELEEVRRDLERLGRA